MSTECRPVSVDEHPMTLKTYIVPTPTIDAMVERVKKLIRLRTPGAIIYGFPRFGKTYSIRYVISTLRMEFPKSVFISFGCEKKKSPSEDAFFTNLLIGAGHKHLGGTNPRKRHRLIERIREMVDGSGYNRVVFFADEAQRLDVIEYEWLRDVHDALERKGIRMLTLSVGQPQLLNVKSAFRHSGQTQIVLRFMITEMRFDGLRSADDFATCLQAYDEAEYPLGSNWAYTRFFFPMAWSAGLRLVDQAGQLWSAFHRAHRLADFKFEMEVPMQYFAYAVEIAFSENMHRDSQTFSFSPKVWDKAVLEASYVAAFSKPGVDGRMSRYLGFVSQVISELHVSETDAQASLSIERIERVERGTSAVIHKDDVDPALRYPSWANQNASTDDLDADADEPIGESELLSVSVVYRAIRRHVWKHVLRRHRRCVIAAARHLWWQMDEEITASFCPVAEGFIRWRMLWEGCGTPRYLFAAPRREFYGLIGWVSSRPSPCPTHWSRATQHWVIDHIFANACLESFRERLVEALGNQTKGRIYWQRPTSPVRYDTYWAVTGSDVPHKPAVIHLRCPMPHPAALYALPCSRQHLTTRRTRLASIVR